MKHIYPFLCLFVPTMKSIFRFACLTDDELRENLYEMDDMIARNLLIGRRKECRQRFNEEVNTFKDINNSI